MTVHAHCCRFRPLLASASLRWLTVLLLSMVELVSGSASGQEDAPPDSASSEAAEITHLQEPQLRESSGLAFSRLKPRRVWSHNDSGGRPRVFSFDVGSGRKTGECRLPGVVAIDWEDMASFSKSGTSWLLVADCGDNQARRSSITLLLFEEPDTDQGTSVRRVQQLRVVFPDGPRDCEAVAVDSRRNQIVLIEKAVLPRAGIYRVPLPPLHAATQSFEVDEQSFKADERIPTIEAQRLATIFLPFVSGMDIDAETGDAWLVNYVQAYRFRCRDRQMALAEQFSQLPELWAVPPMPQIEAVAAQTDENVWVTSEGTPATLGRLSKP